MQFAQRPAPERPEPCGGPDGATNVVTATVVVAAVVDVGAALVLVLVSAIVVGLTESVAEDDGRPAVSDEAHAAAITSTPNARTARREPVMSVAKRCIGLPIQDM